MLVQCMNPTLFFALSGRRKRGTHEPSGDSAPKVSRMTGQLRNLPMMEVLLHLWMEALRWIDLRDTLATQISSDPAVSIEGSITISDLGTKTIVDSAG